MLYKAIIATGFFSTMVMSSPAIAAAAYLGVAPHGDAQAALHIVHGTCAACHGADGNSVSSAFPNLAGQNYNYLLKQLEDFRSGARKAAPMNTMIKTVPQAKGDQNLKDIAAYFSTRKLKGETPGNGQGNVSKKTIEKGYRIYVGGIAKEKVPACSACHVADGLGIAPMAVPALAGQHAAYVLSQLKAFAGGQRHNSPNHVMGTIAGRMKETEMKAVADYVELMEPKLIIGRGPKGYNSYVKAQDETVVPGIPTGDIKNAKKASMTGNKGAQ